MAVACLGWGSLVWRPGDLPVEGGGWRQDGPVLPIEFGRQSEDDRITLVLAKGSWALSVLWNLLSTPSIEEAREALREREGVPKKHLDGSIGHWAEGSRSQHEEAELIGEWAATRRLDGVVWTALGPKFNGRHVMPSAEEVIRHLSRLDGETRFKAKEYVERAPVQIRTPYREEIERVLDWRPIT